MRGGKMLETIDRDRLQDVDLRQRRRIERIGIRVDDLEAHAIVVPADRDRYVTALATAIFDHIRKQFFDREVE